MKTPTTESKIALTAKEGDYAHGDQFIGIRMGTIFNIAKKYGELSVEEIEKLLESPIHEYRVAGVSIMDKLSRVKKTTDERYLFDKPRKILYKLARSKE